MKNSSQIINGGVALLLISGFGCAGPGLKNMFSRNETDGYRTLEEIEAAQAENEATESDGESEGPRFASWLPFGKKPGGDSEMVASAGSTDSADDKPLAKPSLWKNPLRKQETVEADPFLSDNPAAEEVVAKSAKAKTSEKSRSSRPESATDVADRKADKNDALSAAKTDSKSVRTISGTEEKSAESDDELLVQKFEQHFRRNTAETAEDAQSDASAAPLIVAGKQLKAETKTASSEKSAKSTRIESADDDRLLEFEKLLADKKANAAKTTKAPHPASENISGSDFSEDELFAARDSHQKAVRQKSESTAPRAAKRLDSFDSLLEDDMNEGDFNEFETLAAKNASSRDRRSASETHAQTQDGSTEFAEMQEPSDENSADVVLADASGIFGAISPSRGSQKVSENSSSGKLAAGGWSGDVDKVSDFGWSQTRPQAQAMSQSEFPQNSSPARAAARKGLDSTVDKFVSMFAAARSAEAAPQATLPDTPEPGRRSMTRTASQSHTAGAGFGRDNRPGMPIQTVSSTRSLPASLEKPAELSDDAFFNSGSGTTGSPFSSNAETIPSPQESANAAPSSGSTSRFKSKNLLLLLGGIIVVALLFAPGRKKPIQVNQPAV